ncbi:hypothetical protein [Allonocardiopsis opalescens]|uniref:Uncharacterized protein n=1 Tax=Allonocardiopsis opalescens TaxID=1144618 RepID=A0A2T0Q4N8_9ACTN|nr:hypothetical protein [Allonocardiopsis opalescens]PRX98733.1 hypothetical protein CLV72_104312 [Allonocardiopsis opalescens]
MTDPLTTGALASAAATTLVHAMSTDLWEQVKFRIAQLLTRGRPGERDALAERLEGSRTEIMEAPGDRTRAGVETGRWQGQIEALLGLGTLDPVELRGFITEFEGDVTARTATTVIQRNDLSGDATGYIVGSGTQVVQHRDD